jgi:ABC-type sugar transport system ATPase subunit
MRPLANLVTSHSATDNMVPAASLVGIRKAYPGVVAIDDVSLDVRHGEVHALVGENGAGKSTLVKILVGAIRPDAGTIILEGRETALHSTRAARRHGISYIPQDVQAVPGLSVGRNILLGYEHFFSSRNNLGRHEVQTVGTALERAGAVFQASDRTDTLSVPELRLAQIARALVSPGDVMVLDEPTAVLSEADAEHLLTRLRSFLADGKAILYVSHRLTEVLQIASRITVLRDGQQRGTFERDQIDRERIIQLMAKPDRRVRQDVTVDERLLDRSMPPVLEISDLEREPVLRQVSVSVRAGEIVGIAGVHGSGHGHLLHAVAGLDPYKAGSSVVDGVRLVPGSIRDSYAAGAILVPADRRGSAIVPAQSVQSNLMLPIRAVAKRLGFRRLRAEAAVTRSYVDLFGIQPASTQTLAAGLSGGNQQKMALARSFESKPRVLLLEEPLQGIDVNAKVEIRGLIEWLASQGVAVVVATSDFEDLIGLADTVHVMCLGRLVTTLAGEEVTYGEILRHALP